MRTDWTAQRTLLNAVPLYGERIYKCGYMYM